MKRTIPYLLTGLLLLAGLVILFYPTVSSWYNAQYQIEAVIGYDETIARMSEQNLQQELARANEYNTTLTGGSIVDPFIPGGGYELPPDYTSILDGGSGVMGVIIIPKIDVNLPIYHGTSEQVLEKGVGHMEMTAFPIGGEGNHSVLTGHTALPTATLFTNLNKLALGDEFYIEVHGRTIAYQVDKITVVEPTDTKLLSPEIGKDYVTLVTCTPYAVNSHRLLVRGVRIPYEETGQYGDAGIQINTHTWPPIDYAFIVAVAAAVLVIIVMIIGVIRHKKRKRRRHRYRQQHTFKRGGRY